jgi:ribokinase
MGPHIAVVGSINADLVVQMPKLPGRGETVSSAEPAWFPGGKGANQAVAAARMGGNVSMFGAIGADEPGQMCLSALKQSGVNVDAVVTALSPTSTALQAKTKSWLQMALTNMPHLMQRKSQLQTQS